MPHTTCHHKGRWVAVLNHENRRILAIVDRTDGYQVPVRAERGQMSDSQPLRELFNLHHPEWTDQDLLHEAFATIYTRWPQCK